MIDTCWCLLDHVNINMEPQLRFDLVISDYSLLFLRSRNTPFLFYVLDTKSQFLLFNKKSKHAVLQIT